MIQIDSVKGGNPGRAVLCSPYSLRQWPGDQVEEAAGRVWRVAPMGGTKVKNLPDQAKCIHPQYVA